MIDGTGIKVEGEEERPAREFGGAKQRVWRKIYLGIDEETQEIRVFEITGCHVGDAPVLPDLLNQIPAHGQIGSGNLANGNRAYDTSECHDAIADRGAHNVIPRRKDAKPWKTLSAGAMAETRPCGHRNTLAAHCGDDGADTTAETASKRRCAVGNCRGSA